ncbi:MAG: ArsR family transcriptional regulator [Alphaproteobacteria bacterium]|nr:ArsR family transcriptional regulator [Alphaproteobacteria bacterium]
MDFSETLQQDRRLCILRTLMDCGGTLNDSVLRDALERLGHRRLSRDLLRSDIGWLADRGLLKIEYMGPVQLATIQLRGIEVAEGRVTVEGVKPPSLGG